VHTIRRGNVAEAAVLNALVRAGLHVYVPFGEGSPCDMLVERGGALFRVQVKCGRVRSGQRRGNRYASDYAVEDWARSLERAPA
jgi:hypothetical protein